MKRCPRCNEMLPLLSKVCPVCGAVIESEGALNAEDMANQLEYILHDMKSIPVPGFIAGMSRLSVFIVPVISVFLLIIAWISCAGLFWILFFISFIWSVWVIIKRLRGTFKADISENKFRKLRNDYEMLARIAKRDFGENREVKRLLGDISEQISDVEEKWKGEIRKNVFIWIAILIVVITLSITGTCSVSSAVEESEHSAEVMEKDNWETKVEQYLSSSEIEQNDPQLRLLIIKEILDSGNFDEAEKFFLNHLMGQIGDFDCAKEVIRTYQNMNNPEKARAFVEKCAEMRYKSDKEKLMNLVE